MKILLTGATGFIGSYLLQNEKKTALRCVVRKGTSCCHSDSFSIDSLSAKTIWAGAFADIDVVVHLAALAHGKEKRVEDFREVNCLATLHLAREAANIGIKRFVYISSIGVNGFKTCGKPFSSCDVPIPHNAYTQSKYDAEIGLQHIAEKTGLEVVIVRPPLVYGKDAHGNFGRLVRLVKCVPFLPFGFVNNRRSFIAVQNLVDFIMTCVEHPQAAGHVFLPSDGLPISTKEFTCAIAKGLGKSLWQLPVPKNLMYLGAKFMRKTQQAEQLLGDLDVDFCPLFDILGWTPPYSMEEAMTTLAEKKND